MRRRGARCSRAGIRELRPNAFDEGRVNVAFDRSMIEARQGLVCPKFEIGVLKDRKVEILSVCPGYEKPFD